VTGIREKEHVDNEEKTYSSSPARKLQLKFLGEDTKRGTEYKKV